VDLRNPDAKPIKSREFGSLPEELAYERRRAGCQKDGPEHWTDGIAEMARIATILRMI
jgi:hypothetical protein